MADIPLNKPTNQPHTHAQPSPHTQRYQKRARKRKNFWGGDFFLKCSHNSRDKLCPFFGGGLIGEKMFFHPVEFPRVPLVKHKISFNHITMSTTVT